MKENTNRTKLSLKLDSGLVSFLKTQENHKFSRYDAFVWLVEHILDSDVEDCGKPSSAYQEYLVRYTELAKTWHWSRPTVQKFIEGLEAMSVIIKKNMSMFLRCLFPTKARLLTAITTLPPPTPLQNRCLHRIIRSPLRRACSNRQEGSENRIEGRNELKL